MLNILIPMAGGGRRFVEAGYTRPKPLIDVAGKPMVQQALESVAPSGTFRTLLVARREHKGLIWAQNEVTLRAERHGFWIVDSPTEGAASTALLAKDKIDNDDPLLIANCDQIIDWPTGNIDAFIRHVERRDGGILLFPSHGETKWSYANFDPEIGYITRVAEKNPISRWATCGIYYWKRGKDFVRSAEAMIAADDRTNGEFYIAPTYNYLIREGMEIVPHIIPSSAFHGLGTPEDLEKYLAR